MHHLTRDTGAPDTGFSMIELMVVIAIIAMLALLAAPTFQYKVARDQIVEALPLSDLAKKPIAAAWSAMHTLPADNASIDLPAADKIVSNLVSSISIETGAIHIIFGNSASGLLKGKILSLRPAVVEDAPIIPIAWICGFAPIPGNMTAKGENKTNIEADYLPRNCRAK
jgi:type IV pilus assembly protein PilA